MAQIDEFLRADLGLSGSNSAFEDPDECKSIQVPEVSHYLPFTLNPSQREGGWAEELGLSSELGQSGSISVGTPWSQDGPGWVSSFMLPFLPCLAQVGHCPPHHLCFSTDYSLHCPTPRPAHKAASSWGILQTLHLILLHWGCCWHLPGGICLWLSPLLHIPPAISPFGLTYTHLYFIFFSIIITLCEPS